MAAAALRASALLVLLLCTSPAPLAAAEPEGGPDAAAAEPEGGPDAAAAEPEGWSYELAHELMSPYCPGRTLAECPSAKADTLRMWLIVQEVSGRSVEEVKAELVERFGDRILSAPRPEGFGLAAYLVPVLAFVLGGLLVGHFLRKQTREAAAAPPIAKAPVGPGDPELERLVDEELSR